MSCFITVTVPVLKSDLLHKTYSTPNISCSWKRHSAGVKRLKSDSPAWPGLCICQNWMCQWLWLMLLPWISWMTLKWAITYVPAEQGVSIYMGWGLISLPLIAFWLLVSVRTIVRYRKIFHLIYYSGWFPYINICTQLHNCDHMTDIIMFCVRCS